MTANSVRYIVGDAALRHEVEDIFYYEAALLDEWRLDEWLTLLTEDCRYLVPTTDLPAGDPEKVGDQLVFIDDDLRRLRGRVTRLKSRHAHREFPWSRTRRFISNVRVTEASGDEISAAASFLVYRVRLGAEAPFVGRYEYRLRRVNGNLKICFRRAVLDHESIKQHGAISIIL